MTDRIDLMEIDAQARALRATFLRDAARGLVKGLKARMVQLSTPKHTDRSGQPFAA